MKYAFLIIAALFLLSSSADAAFRFKKLQPAGQQTQTQGQHIAHGSGPAFHFRESAYGHAFKRFAPARYHDGGDGPGFGIASLAAAMLSVAGIALGIAGSPVFLVAAGVLAISAIVLGIVGVRRQMKGLAIAGIVIGGSAIIAGIVYAIIVAAAVFAFLGAF